MKNRIYLLIPVVFILMLGSFIPSFQAAGINELDPENDIIGVKYWEGEDSINVDCEWLPENTSMIDIKNITWVDGGGFHYIVNMSFYGDINATLITNEDVEISMFFLINGTDFPEEFESETPDYNFLLSSTFGGSVIGNVAAEVAQMSFSTQAVSFTVNKSLSSETPVALADWKIAAVVQYMYEENISNVIYEYTAIDHYNFEYVEDTLGTLCGIFELQIPGYSIIAVGVVAVFTIGFIIKKKFKK